MNNKTSLYSALSDTDLLKKLIGISEVRKHYRGSLASLFITDHSDAIQPAKCLVARELVKRWLQEELQKKCVLNSPETVRESLRLHFTGYESEAFVAMYLDAQHHLIATHELFRGTLTQTSVYPREVVKAALRENAAAVIFAHNHPSGIAEPSKADEQLTQRLKQALSLVDVQVLDHFIVAGASVLSFAERGLL